MVNKILYEQVVAKYDILSNNISRVKKMTKSRSPVRDLSMGPAEYKGGILLARPERWAQYRVILNYCRGFRGLQFSNRKRKMKLLME
jgi:hypothetical protein